MSDVGDVRLCVSCGVAPVTAVKPGRLALSKSLYCPACRQSNRQRPRTTLTAAQQAQLRPLLGQLPYTELCARVGCSRAALVRWLRAEGLHSNTKPYPPGVVEAVLAVYVMAPPGQGKQRVQELFPDVNVRSIVERYQSKFGIAKRQRRWTAEEKREAVKMAGLVSTGAQARWFKRPNASDGAITSLWIKSFGTAPGAINGLGVHLAWRLVRPGCPAVIVRHRVSSGAAAKILWIDLAAWLRPEVEPWIAEAVRALARFQWWVHGVQSREEIVHMITERETDASDTPSRDEWDPTSPGDEFATGGQPRDPGPDGDDF